MTIADNGKITFGKYTFFIMFSLLVKDPDAVDNAFEKKFQKTRPHKTKRGYGRFPEGIFAKFPKKIVKISIDAKG